MKIKHIKTEHESIVTKDEWDLILQNGFASDFEVLVPDVAPPKEVMAAIKETSETDKKK